MSKYGVGDALAIAAIAFGAIVGHQAIVEWLVPSQSVVDQPREIYVLEPVVEEAPSVEPKLEIEIQIEPTPEPFVDPRGSARGPTDLEWEIIHTYKVIESMTATDPPTDVVDETLLALWEYADDNRDNPFVQELYLKGLRVAQYYAAEVDDHARSTLLISRFDAHAVQHVEQELVQREIERMHAQLEEIASR